MTGNDVFAGAAAYLSQSTADSEDLAPFVPLWLNVLLAECLPYENMLRAQQGMEPLAEAPRLTQGAMDTDIPYREVILRTARSLFIRDGITAVGMSNIMRENPFPPMRKRAVKNA